RTRTVFGARSYGMSSRFITEIPVALTDHEEQPTRGTNGFRARTGSPAAASWSAAPSWSSQVTDEPAPPAFRLGDDVVHAAFGEGVVTGVEPGGIVVIRFSKD